MPPRFHLWLVCVGSLVWLAGCTGPAQDELQVWMQAERNAIEPRVQPIPEPSRFTPQAYAGTELLDPFSSERLAAAMRGSPIAALPNAALIEPELARRKQPLEAFPLDTMAMVGSIERQGQLVALVKVNQLLYQVRPGNYLGQNFGRVTRITESEVTLREIVQDGAGEWIERPAVLQLQEEASK